MWFIEFFNVKMLVLFVLVFFPLEHLLPIHRGRPALRSGLLTDLMHFLFTGVLIRVGLFAVIVASVQLGSALVPATVRTFSASLPLWLQVVAATVIADLGFYLSHRLLHAVPFLWNFHAVHHSSEQLDWLAAYRVHPVDQVIVKGSSLVPIFALGFSETAIIMAALIYQWQALVIHSNVNVKIGPLKWLIATPQFHHWHHSNHPEAFDKNFAGQIPLWDVVFGTVHQPRTEMPTKYGVDDPVPGDWLNQLLYPFRPSTRAVRTTGATGAVASSAAELAPLAKPSLAE
jgi:sterol desaturase/sphingolipid hydroxylase (fatty acid hydroxylase superfamily)